MHVNRPFIMTVFFVSLLSLTGGGKKEEQPAPPLVDMQQVFTQPVAAEFEFVARTRAREDAEIRARITGAIVERNFSEGQKVDKDALLFRIDPRPYQTALDAALAELARASMKQPCS